MRPSFIGSSTPPTGAVFAARKLSRLALSPARALTFNAIGITAVTPPSPFNPRRLAFGAAKKLIFENEDPATALERIAGFTSIDNRGTLSPESKYMSRTRATILNNLDEMYREAFERAKASGDQAQMAALDFAYRREQLYFEILLDVRDALERR
jgi:hypothetical protein